MGLMDNLTVGAGGGGEAPAPARVVRPSALTLTTVAGAPSYDGDGRLTMVAGDAVVGTFKDSLNGLDVIANNTVTPSGANRGLIIGLDQGDASNAKSVGISLLSAPRGGTLNGLWSASPLSSIFAIQGSSLTGGSLQSGGIQATLTMVPYGSTTTVQLALVGRRGTAQYSTRGVAIAGPTEFKATPATWNQKRIVLACTSGTWIINWIAELFGGNDVDLSAL